MVNIIWLILTKRSDFLAKETLDVLRQAEENAQMIISDAKIKCEEIIQKANDKKAELLQDLEIQKKENLNKVCEEAKATAENISSMTKVEISDSIKALEEKYLEKKEKAIGEVINTIL